MDYSMGEFSAAAEIFFLATVFGLYAFWFLNPEMLFLITCAYALFFLSFILKTPIARPFLIGLVLSFLYLTFYRNIYTYQTMGWSVLGYPLYPLLAWPLALTLLGRYLDMFFDGFAFSAVKAKVAFAYAFYCLLLIFMEYTAYHYHQIRLTSQYESIPLIDCMHAPLSLKLVYFVNGLFFFTAYYCLQNNERRVSH